MNKGLQLDVKWHDNDVLEICITARNERFGGSVNTYVAIGDLEETAERLKGFPYSPRDKREVAFGEFGPKVAGGAASMRLYCSDGAGHAYVESRLEADCPVAGITQSVVLVLQIEPAALDSFLEDLRRLEAEKKGHASLRAI